MRLRFIAFIFYKIIIQYEAPTCPWEVYICATLKHRLPKEFVGSVMQIRDAYMFTNASAIVYDYSPYGTLLVSFILILLFIIKQDLSNLYKTNNAEMGGLLATFFAIQLGKILEQVHAANLIHGDVKPDNVLLSTRFNLKSNFYSNLRIVCSMSDSHWIVC